MVSKSSFSSQSSTSQALKEETMAKYRSLSSALDDSLKEIFRLHPSNDEFASLISDLIQTLQNKIEELRYEVDVNLQNLRWDKLVIAFFGETGAGKSTIIETLRILFDPNRDTKNDGAIVGDGRPDFTKEAKEYELSINGRPFILVDVPGIEGDEKKYHKIIYDALSKAHIIFYVNLDDRIPDEGTAGKIKAYLGNWARVYTIQNVFKGASDYEEEEDRKTLLTDEILKEEKEIEARFKKILGNIYEGNIPIQALLALCSTKANFSPDNKKLVMDQRYVLEYFKNPDEVMKFSQFQTLLNLVGKKSRYFTKEIDKSNWQKVLGYATKITSSIDKIIESHKDETENKLQLLKDFRSKVNIELSKLGKGIQQKVLSYVRCQFDILKNEIQEDLKSNKKKKEKKNEIREQVISFYSTQSYQLQKYVQKNIDIVLKQIKSQSERIEGIEISKINFPKLQVDYKLDSDSLEDNINELDLNLDDVGDVATTTAWGVSLGSIGGLPGIGVGAVVGSLLGIAKKHFSYKSKKKASATESILSMLDESLSSVEKDIRKSMPLIKQQIDNLKGQILSMVNLEINNANRIGEIKEELDKKINLIIMGKNYGRV